MGDFPNRGMSSEMPVVNIRRLYNFGPTSFTSFEHYLSACMNHWKVLCEARQLYISNIEWSPRPGPWLKHDSISDVKAFGESAVSMRWIQLNNVDFDITPKMSSFWRDFPFLLKSHQWNRQHEHQKQINRFGKAKDSERNSDAMGFLHLSAGGGFLLKRLRFIWRPSIHMASIFAPLWGYSCDSCAVGSPGGDDSYIYIYISYLSCIDRGHTRSVQIYILNPLVKFVWEWQVIQLCRCKCSWGSAMMTVSNVFIFKGQWVVFMWLDQDWPTAQGQGKCWSTRRTSALCALPWPWPDHWASSQFREYLHLPYSKDTAIFPIGISVGSSENMLWAPSSGLFFKCAHGCFHREGTVVSEIPSDFVAESVPRKVHVLYVCFVGVWRWHIYIYGGTWHSSQEFKFWVWGCIWMYLMYKFILFERKKWRIWTSGSYDFGLNSH